MIVIPWRGPRWQWCAVVSMGILLIRTVIQRVMMANQESLRANFRSSIWWGYNREGRVLILLTISRSYIWRRGRWVSKVNHLGCRVYNIGRETIVLQVYGPEDFSHTQRLSECLRLIDSCIKFRATHHVIIIGTMWKYLINSFVNGLSTILLYNASLTKEGRLLSRCP